MNTYISNEKYKDAKKVWNIFKCAKFRDYYEIYLKVDTLLLADVFDNFRQTCLGTYYEIDPTFITLQLWTTI